LAFAGFLSLQIGLRALYRLPDFHIFSGCFGRRSTVAAFPQPRHVPERHPFPTPLSAAHTSLSRARERTRVYVIGEATVGQRQREEYAPPEPERTNDEALEVLNRAMRRREAERLAMQAIEPEYLPPAPGSAAERLPITELPEAGAEAAAVQIRSGVETGWRTPGRWERSAQQERGPGGRAERWTAAPAGGENRRLVSAQARGHPAPTIEAAESDSPSPTWGRRHRCHVSLKRSRGRRASRSARSLRKRLAVFGAVGELL